MGNPGETFLDASCGPSDLCCGGFNRLIILPPSNATFTASFDHCGELVIKRSEGDSDDHEGDND